MYLTDTMNLLQLTGTKNTWHITASCSKISSSNWPHMFKNFLHPLIRSTSSVQIYIFVSHSSVQKLSPAMNGFKNFRHPFHLILLKNFCHLFIYQPFHFKWLSLSISHPFTCRVFTCKECFRVRGHIIYILRKNKGAGHCF